MSDSKITRHIQGEDDQQRSLSVPDGTLQPGQTLQGRYRIIGIIGMGGMGAVYQARDMRFEEVTRLCAVKEMINMAKDQNVREQTMKQFQREAELLATLDHPAIPKIYDFFGFGDRAYLVLEFIQGKNLEEILNSTDGLLPHETVRQWAIEVCDVLSYLHNHKPEPIIFRDMKPSNVMVDHLDRVRLIDFGIAKTFQLGQPGTMIGTEGYSPPEQYKGIATPAADIYALGATLHQLLTDRDPRLEAPFSFEEAPISDFNPNVPEAFVSVVQRALSYDPDDRYGSADAMKQSLQGIGERQMAPQQQAAPSKPGTGPKSPTSSQQQPQQVERAATFGGTRMVESEFVKPIWNFKVEDAVRSTPVVHNGTLYVGSYDNNLWALNASDGELRWKFATSGGIGSSPAYAGGMVFVGSTDTRLYAVDARSGKPKWDYKTKDKIYSTPHAAMGMVFFGSDDGRLYAIKPSSVGAREVWDFHAMYPIRSSPIVDEETESIGFGLESGDFVCLDLSGSPRWRFQSRRRIMSSPTIHDGMMIFGSDDWYVYAIDLASGYLVWRFQTRGKVISSPAAGKDMIFIGSTDGHLYALDAMSGREEWKVELEDRTTSSPAVYRDTVYIGCLDGSLYAFHTDTGDLLWRFQSQKPIISSPTVYEDMVFVGSDDKNIYALNA